MRIRALIIKEFLAVLQDKKSRFVLIVPPLLQLFIFAFAATLDVKNVSLAILNNDEGKQSHELTQRFQGSPYFTQIRYLRSVEEIKNTIDTQAAIAVLHIDALFSRNLLARKPSEVQLILDGRKSNSAQVVQGYVQKIVEQYNADLAHDLLLPTPTTYLIPRNWFNPDLIYLWFTVPGLIAILTMMISLLLTAMSIARERELGTFEQLLVSPLRPIDILIGKAVPGILIGMLEGTVILMAAVFCFKIPFTGSLILFYFAMFIFVCSIVGIGLFLSAVSKTQQQALLAVFVFMAPAVILSGYATPIENMPSWLQTGTLANPLRHFLVIVRGILLKEMPPWMVLSNMWPIAIIACFTLTFSTLFFRRRLG